MRPTVVLYNRNGIEVLHADRWHRLGGFVPPGHSLIGVASSVVEPIVTLTNIEWDHIPGMIGPFGTVYANREGTAMISVMGDSAGFLMLNGPIAWRTARRPENFRAIKSCTITLEIDK